MSSSGKEGLSEKAARMAEIRIDRRAAGFAEVTVWVPDEEVRSFRDKAWEAVEAADRDFPHRAPAGRQRRQRSRK